jgi:predicted deacetylase
MNKSKFLLRFDDICPTMNWSVWEKIESILIFHGISPILAVVPENMDPKLMISSPNPKFWDRVRYWQSMGWSIALHGYQHLYVNNNAGILDLTPQSEFAGLAFNVQNEKIKKGLAVFNYEGIKPDAWIAPSHSFDIFTINALLQNGINTISDGLALFPYEDRSGMTWVPQQFGTFFPFPIGVWTFCYHHNCLTESSLSTLLNKLSIYSSRFISLQDAVILSNQRPSHFDILVKSIRRIRTYFFRVSNYSV